MIQRIPTPEYLSIPSPLKNMERLTRAHKTMEIIKRNLTSRTEPRG